MTHSRIPGFYQLDIPERKTVIQERFDLTDMELAILEGDEGLTTERADKMVENCVGVLGIPLGLGLNFRINDVERVIPMAVEEPSIIAAVSYMARIVRGAGGFTANADAPTMIGQIQILDVPDPKQATERIEAARDQIIDLANAVYPNLLRRDQGAKELEVRRFDGEFPMLVVHIFIDCGESMGANAINSMAEGVAPLLEELSGGRSNLRILSNLADRRLARATCCIPNELLKTKNLSGEDVARGIIEAYQFAAVDPYRAATHNKGVMNGIDAVALATGNDWRAIEAGAHAYAARDGQYRPLTRWWQEDDSLHGQIELPLAVGVVGGSTRVHPTLGVVHKICGHPSAQELAMAMAAVGLAQNLGALRALSTEGIQRGHMSLHARSIAVAIGAHNQEVQRVADRMVAMDRVNATTAKEILGDIRLASKPSGPHTTLGLGNISGSRERIVAAPQDA